MRVSSSLVACALYLGFAAAAPVVPKAGDIITRNNARSQGHIGAIVRAVAASPGGNGGLDGLTKPVLGGVVNPLTTGLGQGVAAAAEGTQEATEQFGEAFSAFNGLPAKIPAKAFQGLGVAVKDATPAVQGTVDAIEENDGLVGA